MSGPRIKLLGIKKEREVTIRWYERTGSGYWLGKGGCERGEDIYVGQYGRESTNENESVVGSLGMGRKVGGRRGVGGG